ncbi:hypothetical protein KHC27_08520 [Ancylobacter lacus]|nr:hypothetical protein [Ancylobacter lacus]
MTGSPAATRPAPAALSMLRRFSPSGAGDAAPGTVVEDMGMWVSIAAECVGWSLVTYSGTSSPLASFAFMSIVYQ